MNGPEVGPAVVVVWQCVWVCAAWRMCVWCAQKVHVGEEMGNGQVISAEARRQQPRVRASVGVRCVVAVGGVVRGMVRGNLHACSNGVGSGNALWRRARCRVRAGGRHRMVGAGGGSLGGSVASAAALCVRRSTVTTRSGTGSTKYAGLSIEKGSSEQVEYGR